jgi:transcriptional regulator with AAA-type ATPase domain
VVQKKISGRGKRLFALILWRQKSCMKQKHEIFIKVNTLV